MTTPLDMDTTRTKKECCAYSEEVMLSFSLISDPELARLDVGGCLPLRISRLARWAFVGPRSLSRVGDRMGLGQTTTGV